MAPDQICDLAHCLNRAPEQGLISEIVAAHGRHPLTRQSSAGSTDPKGG
jgi:hypothetical protein